MPDDQRDGTAPSKTDIVWRKRQSGRDFGLARQIPGRGDRQAWRGEAHVARIGRPRLEAARHVADLFFQNEFSLAAAVEQRKQNRGADRRMTRKRHLGSRIEDADRGAISSVGRREHEYGFGIIEFARDRLHRVGFEACRLKHNGERISGKFLFREHVEGEEAAFHCDLTRADGSNTRAGLTISSCASIRRISREPFSAVRSRMPNTDDAARDSACATDWLCR